MGWLAGEPPLRLLRMDPGKYGPVRTASPQRTSGAVFTARARIRLRSSPRQMIPRISLGFPDFARGCRRAVWEASRGIKASYGAHPCPLCARASGVTVVTGTRPCCAGPGQRIASRRQDPGNHARWPRSWTRSERPALSGGSGPSIPPSSAPRPFPCAELLAGGPWAPPQDPSFGPSSFGPKKSK